IVTLVDGLLGIGARIMGLFGIGKYGGETFIDNIIGLLTKPGEMWGEIVYNVTERFQKIWDNTTEMWNTIMESLREMLGIDWLEAKFKELWDGIVSGITGWFTSFEGYLTGLSTDLEEWLRSFSFIDTLLNKIDDIFNAITSYLPSRESISKWLKSKIPF